MIDVFQRWHEAKERAASGRVSWRTLALLGYIVVGGFVALILWFAIARPVQVVPRIRPVSPFVLRDQNNQWIDVLDLKGRLLLITFSYTRCQKPCAALNEQLVALHSRLAQDATLRDTIQFLTISFDTNYDTPDVLRSHVAQLPAGAPNWRWLSGPSDDVKAVVGGGFGVYYEAQPQPGGNGNDVRFVHDQRVVLVDTNGLVRADYTSERFTPERVLRDIGLIQKEAASSGAMRQVYEASHLFLCYPD